MCLKFEVCLARSRWCTRRDNHKSKLLTSCFRPISWQPQKRDNAEIAILMWARFAAFFYKKNSWKAHAHQASYLAGARARASFMASIQEPKLCQKRFIGRAKKRHLLSPNKNRGDCFTYTQKMEKRSKKKPSFFIVHILLQDIKKLEM